MSSAARRTMELGRQRPSTSCCLDTFCYIYNIVEMSVPIKEVPWLLLVFSLPTRRASQRVQIWRNLQRYGMLALRSSGYVLPNSAVNQERMEWLPTPIRTYNSQG